MSITIPPKLGHGGEDESENIIWAIVYLATIPFFIASFVSLAIGNFKLAIGLWIGIGFMIGIVAKVNYDVTKELRKEKRGNVKHG